jgi:hypothetical protein
LYPQLSWVQSGITAENSQYLVLRAGYKYIFPLLKFPNFDGFRIFSKKCEKNIWHFMGGPFWSDVEVLTAFP